MEQEVKQLLEMFSATSTSYCSHLFEDLSHHRDVDTEASTSHTIESYRDKFNDHQRPLHAISREDFTSTMIDFYERRLTFLIFWGSDFINLNIS
jgi:hypothetical protein